MSSDLDVWPWAAGERSTVARFETPGGRWWVELYTQQINCRDTYGLLTTDGPGEVFGFVTRARALAELQARIDDGRINPGAALARVETKRGGAR